ncbi:carboxynorspermidine decarboxylase [Sellimonas caecigallum]|uniref:Carboxynorspermidine decarboxylase n=1 Tax=Sellimonas caecigallum TaxID=2592333 RepID=A0ABS7L939_9FIRM|nr:carboxynorspermidine decarboxylase [Sellimonas caecigallum]MBY0759487.1 carboxynorspermidine decarboxylase [Sellimonas caecigallum]
MRKEELRTPCYIVQKANLIRNLEELAHIRKQTGCKILLAQKAFSMYSLYPLIGQYLDGTAASGLYEARLGAEEMGKENHVYAPAFREDEMEEILKYSDHIVFNSFHQLQKYQEQVKKAGGSIGIRINPECSTQEGHAIYDPCAPGSRLGVTIENFRPDLLEYVDGFHFHTLCEQNSDDLKKTLEAVEEKFGVWMHQMKWINFGGGHHITRPDYDKETLIECILHVKEIYGVEVYLEPGEAVALNAGSLVTSVLETGENRIRLAILDTSAACHMPDVLEMPYRPPLKDSGLPEEKMYTYRLGGPTCLAGDIIGDYSFDHPLKEGERLEFLDMAIYSMVKNNTFNGMRLPSIAVEEEDGNITLVRKFGYDDFKMRL